MGRRTELRLRQEMEILGMSLAMLTRIGLSLVTQDTCFYLVALSESVRGQLGERVRPFPKP